MSRLNPILSLLLLLLTQPAVATTNLYEMRLLEDGVLFTGTVEVGSDQQMLQQLFLVDVFDFEISLHGILYSNTYPTAQNPMPAFATFTGTGDLLTLETPYVHSENGSTLINLRLLDDGTFVRDICFPVETCSPNYGTGTYELWLVPEPSSAWLLSFGLVYFATKRKNSWLRSRQEIKRLQPWRPRPSLRS